MLRSDASLLDAYPSRLVTKGDEYEGLQFLSSGDPLPKIWRFAVLRLIMNRRQQWRKVLDFEVQRWLVMPLRSIAIRIAQSARATLRWP